MSGRKKKRRSGKKQHGGNKSSQRKTTLRVQWIEDCQSWALVHPRCARDRADDIEEVQRMIAEGESDVAIDELRWLLTDCSDFIDAHRLLGELAIDVEDWPLARGHLGYCFDIGSAALGAAGSDGPLSHDLPTNRGLLAATYLFAGVLHRLEKRKTSRSVLRQLLAWDPNDPLGVGELLSEIDRPPGLTAPGSGLPLVELKSPEWKPGDDDRERTAE